MHALRDRRGGKKRDWQDPQQLRAALLAFVADFANWDYSTNWDFQQTARHLTRVAHETLGGEAGTRPLVLDPFAGGGAIPLEALRVGADALSSDSNPIAALLNKVVTQYIPTHGERLVKEVRNWGAWVKEQAKTELSRFYPTNDDRGVPIAYFWARMIRCEGPACGIRYPLLRTTTLTTKQPKAYVTLEPRRDGRTAIHLHEGKNPKSTGTIYWGKSTCPACGYTMPETQVKAQLVPTRGGANDSELYAILYQADAGRYFREPTRVDAKAFLACQHWMQTVDERDPERLPSENINPRRPYKNTVGVCIVTRIGIGRFRDLYNARQLRSLIVLQDCICQVRDELTGNGALQDAVVTLLHIAFDRMVFQNSSLSRWNTSRSTIEGMFSKQALQIVWDYVEANPLGAGSANWDGALDWIIKVMERCGNGGSVGTVLCADARKLPLPDNSVDLLFTDPPYFAAVPYGDLSDVFYVWLRRGLGNVHPDLFRDRLVEKQDELIVTNSAKGPEGVPKDTDENYLAVWQARETVENGLRLGVVGNLISTTVLRTLTKINLSSLAVCGLFGFYAAQRGTGGHDCRQVRGGVAGIG